MTLAPTRGKDLPLKALESERTHARDAVYAAEEALRMARYKVEQAEKELAIRRRDRDDVERAIIAIRAMPTEPLVNYQREARTDPLPSGTDNAPLTPLVPAGT